MGSTYTPRFRKIQTFQTSYAPTIITQYESERSGLQVIVADRKGPKINSYLTLATEIFDDSGAPHALEHLVSMGSKSYHYKGLLNKLASRAYSRTNASTDVDHTEYTLETAGWDGFAQILPVYLEHILLPNITDETCMTEVHHIDGEGNDKGVIYSEMQGLQFDSTEPMDAIARRLLYPENIGFRYETAGMLEALRVLTPERIREFHRTMYQPRNLVIIVVGETNHHDLLRILDQFEESIKDDIPPLDAPFQRPWIDSPQPPPLKETIVESVEFPEEDESTGEIMVAFFGPNCTDLTETSALSVLLTYLCGSSASVIENVIVEKEQLASSVSYSLNRRPNSVIWLQPTGVDTDKLEFVERRLISLIKEVASKPLDMNYLKECISRERREIKLHAENSGAHFYAHYIIADYLFGNRDGSTLRQFEHLSAYDVIDAWTDEQWRNFLRKWFSEAPHVSILGKPSIALADELNVAEEARLAKRREELGPEGLKELAEKVERAKALNNQKIPESVLDKWPVPGTESIHFIESTTARSGKAKALGTPVNPVQTAIDKAQPGLPLFMQFEDVPSNFVHITVHVGTSEVPTKLKPLLSLFTDNFFNMPILRDGKRIDFEDVVMELEKDTVNYELSEGGIIGDPESMVIQFQIEPEKYTTVIRWIRTMMFDSVFDPQRLKAAVAKALADIPEAKRDGRIMSLEVDMAIHTVKESFPVAKRTLVKAVYLRRLKKLLENDPDTVVGWFEELRRSMFTFQNMRVLITADVAKLEQPVKTWDILTSDLDADKDVMPIIKRYTMLNEEGQSPGKFGAVLVPMTTLDSSYSVSTAVGLSSFADPRLPAMLVAIGYLESVEGPLWNAVRGNGLAYGTSFSREVDGGYLQYRVFRSPDASKVIDTSRTAVEAIATGRVPLDRHLVEGVVSGIVMGFADDQATMAAAAQQNFVLTVILGLEHDWNQRILAQVRNVTDDDIRAVMNELIMPVFVAGKSNVVVTCAPILRENMIKAFKAMGYAVQTQQLSHFHDDYGFKGDDDEELDEDGSGSVANQA